MSESLRKPRTGQMVRQNFVGGVTQFTKVVMIELKGKAISIIHKGHEDARREK